MGHCDLTTCAVSRIFCNFEQMSVCSVSKISDSAERVSNKKARELRAIVKSWARENPTVTLKELPTAAPPKVQDAFSEFDVDVFSACAHLVFRKGVRLSRFS